MDSLVEKIANKENLMLAWRKIENLFVPGDVWFDPLKLAAFKYRLKDNVDQISDSLLAGTYRLKPIIPVPFPKSRKEGDEEIPIRQSFIIDVADQLVWVAVCNVIGVYLDTKMPAWSYGNRLYIRWWKDLDDKWQVGNYRNSVPSLYRNWNQSWPQMRKKITVSLKLMAGMGTHLTKEEKELQQKEQEVPDSVAHYARLKYMERDYFTEMLKEHGIAKNLYWCGIDLKKFYPHVKIQEVITVILRELKRENDEQFVGLLKALSTFELNCSEFEGREEDLKNMGLCLDEAVFGYLPTGLLVSGFLANVFMLDIDRKADQYLNAHKDVIHFRYVDDHVMVARTTEALKAWVDEYVSYILDDSDEGLEINFKKAEPENVLGNYEGIEGKIKLSMYEGCKKDILEKDGILDPYYPTPLMTQNLQKVSLLSKEKLPLLTATEFEMVFKDLQTMLVTDIPEQEISKQTRISFACTMLSRLLIDGNVDYHHVHEVRRELYDQVRNSVKAEDEEELRKRLSLLYNENYILTKEEKDTYPGFDFTKYTALNQSVIEGEAESIDKAETIFFLLRRAIRDVPEKVKVWVRTFNFAVNHYPEGIRHLVDELNDMKANPVKLHPLSVLYLESIIEMLAAQHIMSILARLRRNDYTSSRNKKNDISSLKHLTTIHFENDGFGFKIVTGFMMQQALGCYQALYEKLGLERIKSIQPLYGLEYPDGTVLDSTFWQTWKIDAYHLSSKDVSIMSDLMNGELSVKVDSPFFESYLYELLSLADNDLNFIKGFLPQQNTLEELSQEMKYAISMTDVDGRVFGIEPQQVQNKEGFITLRDWIVQTEKCKNNEIQKGEKDYLRNFLSEAVYSEWMSVRLMLSIAKAVQNELNTDDDRWNPENMNPATIWIKKDERLAVTWEKRGDCAPFEVYLSNDVVEGAERYYTIPQLYDTFQAHNAVCYGLGLVFLHILTRRLYFPWVMNSPDYGFEWRAELNHLLNHGEVSSVNYNIVEECLSGWNRESVRMIRDYREVNQLELFKKDDVDYDEKIRDIDQLVKRLESSYVEMNNNLISVPGNVYRQLLEISVL